MLKQPAFMLFLLSSLTLSAAVSSGSRSGFKSLIIRIFPFISDHFFVVVKGQCYRTKQLSTKKLSEYVNKHQIKTVINLRANAEKSKNAEVELCKKINVQFHHVPLVTTELPKPEAIEYLLNIFENAPKPLLFHCRAGVDRTGLACALWKYEMCNCPLDNVLKQLSFTRFGHTSAIYPNMKQFIKIWDNLRRVKGLSREQALVAYAALPQFASATNSLSSSMSSSNSLSMATTKKH